MASITNVTVSQTPVKRITDSGFVLEDFKQRGMIAGIAFVAFVIGIIGNTLVILAVTLSRRLRSPTNWLVVNLAITDFIICVFIPINIATMTSQQDWLLPEWLCAVSGGVSFVCVTSSTTSLVLIAFNRWFLLTKPLVLFQKTFKKNRMFLIVASAWLYSVLLVAVPPLAGVGALGFSYKYKTCTLVDDALGAELYAFILGVGMFVLPSVPIVVFYILIFRFVRRHTLSKMASHIAMRYATDAASDDGVSSVSHMPQDAAEHGASSTVQNTTTTFELGRPPAGFSREQVTLTKKLALIVCVLFVCFLPIMVCTLVPSDATDPAVAWAETLVIVNSCLNPIIYARTIPGFREMMGYILRCRYDSIPEPIGFLRRLRSK